MAQHQILQVCSCSQKAGGGCAEFVDSPFFLNQLGNTVQVQDPWTTAFLSLCRFE